MKLELKDKGNNTTLVSCDIWYIILISLFDVVDIDEIELYIDDKKIEKPNTMTMGE